MKFRFENPKKLLHFFFLDPKNPGNKTYQSESLQSNCRTFRKSESNRVRIQDFFSKFLSIYIQDHLFVN